MKQKTVRFYEESKTDMEAYEKLEQFRKFGFNSGRELIIAAVNAYSQSEKCSEMKIDIEKLAELIWEKLGVNASKVLNIKEEVPTNTIRDTEIMDKALSFMESL